MSTKPDVHQNTPVCPRIGDLIALPLTYEPGGEMLDARGKQPDYDKTESDIDDIGAAVVRALNVHDKMLAALKATLPIVRADYKRALAEIGDGEDAEGKADGAIAVLQMVDNAIAKAEGRS